jgi:hypothetical protein
MSADARLLRIGAGPRATAARVAPLGRRRIGTNTYDAPCFQQRPEHQCPLAHGGAALARSVQQGLVENRPGDSHRQTRYAPLRVLDEEARPLGADAHAARSRRLGGVERC